ncbi:MAG: ABC transporter substrate-binding protein [Pseudomonadota bacterium]
MRHVQHLVIAAFCVLMTAASASANEFGWPQAWFEPNKTAHEVGLTQFSQSPYLDKYDLPPVEDRLPDDPVVVTPLKELGKYGGTVRTTRNEWLTYPNVEPPITISADMRTLLPNFAKSWEISEDGRHLTVHLRRGIKWSDGYPLNSGDLSYVFNDLWLNKEYAPVTSRYIRGGKAIEVDPLTIRYEFAMPNPLFVNFLAQYGNFLTAPRHYYQQFHPDYVDRDALNKKLKEMGFISWMAFYNASRRFQIEESLNAPTLDAFRIVSWTPMMMKYERNPYYFKVDPQGRQLPYVDKLESKIVQNKEVITAMASTGQLDFSAFELRTQDIPLLKLGERTGKINVNIWQRLHSSDVVIQPNYNFKHDERLRKVYWDFRFRRALSIAINREEMNDIIYFGYGTPRQVTAHPTSIYFEPEFATAHTEYDPDTARALLDEVGLKDLDGDGLREYPDGKPFTITLEYIDFETPKGISMELVSHYWREVGIDLRLKLVDGNLQAARAVGGEMQMTIWHADRVTDILLAFQPDWWVPRRVGWDMMMWNDWSRWHNTHGKMGEKPPPIMLQLQAWADEIRATMDEERRIELVKKMLAANAENLWTIGTVGLAPHPVVTSKRLRGMPKKGIWGWDNRWTLSYHPATWYLDGQPDTLATAMDKTTKLSTKAQSGVVQMGHVAQ